MTDEEKKLLKDIEQAVLNVDVHLEGRRNFEAFAASLQAQGCRKRIGN